MSIVLIAVNKRNARHTGHSAGLSVLSKWVIKLLTLNVAVNINIISESGMSMMALLILFRRVANMLSIQMCNGDDVWLRRIVRKICRFISISVSKLLCVQSPSGSNAFSCFLATS